MILIMAQEDPAPCFIVIGIVMFVFDLVIIESTYLMVLGGFFVFLGIMFSITMNNRKQKSMASGGVQAQPQQHVAQQQVELQEITQEPIQDFRRIEELPQQHIYCPYCGRETTADTCPDCGKQID